MGDAGDHRILNSEVHELRLAHDDALSCDLLRPLTNKVDGLNGKLSGLVGGLKNGSVNPAAILNASNATDALGSASSSLGVGIKDIASSHWARSTSSRGDRS